MNSRRHFLAGAAAAAGMVFCGCGVAGAAHAQSVSARPARRPVLVSGKRIKTIDVHSHCLFHESANLMGEAGAKMLTPPINNSAEAWLAIDERIAAMDKQEIGRAHV